MAYSLPEDVVSADPSGQQAECCSFLCRQTYRNGGQEGEPIFTCISLVAAWDRDEPIVVHLLPPCNSERLVKMGPLNVTALLVTHIVSDPHCCKRSQTICYILKNESNPVQKRPVYIRNFGHGYTHFD